MYTSTQGNCISTNKPCVENSEFTPIPEPKVFLAYDTKNADFEWWESILSAYLESFGFKLITYNESPILGGQTWCSSVCQPMRKCAFVIADISNCDTTAKRYNANPNVMLELGLARGLGKTEILISSSDDIAPPVNLAGMRVFTKNDILTLKSTIQEYCKKIPTFLPHEAISDPISVQQRVTDIERLEGTRYYFADKFSVLTRPRETTEKLLAHKIHTGWTDEDKQKYMELLDERIEIFKNSVKKNTKYIDVYHKADIERYLLGGETVSGEHEFSVEDRIQHIDNILHFLEFDNYEIIFTELNNFNFLSKESSIVAITPQRGYYGDWSSCLLLSYKEVIDDFKKQIAEALQRAAMEQTRNKQQTIAFLLECRETLESATE